MQLFILFEREWIVTEDKEQRIKSKTKTKDVVESAIEDEEIQKYSWQDQLIEELQNIPPSAFERLCQRLLRELGFQNLEVTGQSNAGGIDGKGMLRLGGVLSFHVIFSETIQRECVTVCGSGF